MLRNVRRGPCEAGERIEHWTDGGGALALEAAGDVPSRGQRGCGGEDRLHCAACSGRIAGQGMRLLTAPPPPRRD